VTSEFLTFVPLKMDVANYSEMLVPTYKTTWCYIPEDHNLDTLRCLSLATDYDHLSLMTSLVVNAHHQMKEQLWMMTIVKNVAVIHCD
jgi:hypothetical protein